MAKDQFEYDSVPYPSYTFPQTHPDRLSTAGALMGVQTAHPEKCRVLELGCGDGTNLLSFAYALPESEFFGVDLSAVHIDKGFAVAKALGLTNIELRQEDVTNIGHADLGEFDFIVAHGLFSWVPDFVREHVLRIYNECLAPNGVGYISYNAYPGCHVREISSGIMRFQADAFDDPAEKVEQGIACLKLVTDATEEASLYQTMLKLELEQIIERSEQNVFHDDLSPVNQPFYFHEFDAMLGQIGMQFLAEADPSASNAGKFEPEAQAVLRSLGSDTRRREQFIDLIRCRRFRSTLFCRDIHELFPEPSDVALRSFFVSTQLAAVDASPELGVERAVKFTGPKGASVEINHPLTKAGLVYLSSISAKGTGFGALIDGAAGLLGIPSADDLDIEKTAGFLHQMFQAGFVKLRRYQPTLSTVAGKFPTASKFARWQIENGNESVTMLTGSNLTPENDASRALISMLDGTRDRNLLVSAMKEIVEVPESEKAAFESGLPELIESELEKFAQAGLLVS